MSHHGPRPPPSRRAGSGARRAPRNDDRSGQSATGTVQPGPTRRWVEVRHDKGRADPAPQEEATVGAPCEPARRVQLDAPDVPSPTRPRFDPAEVVPGNRKRGVHHERSLEHRPHRHSLRTPPPVPTQCRGGHHSNAYELLGRATACSRSRSRSPSYGCTSSWSGGYPPPSSPSIKPPSCSPTASSATPHMS